MDQLLAPGPEPYQAEATRPGAGDGGGAFKTSALGLPRHMTAATAFLAIIGGGLAHFLGNTPAVRAGEAEGLHQTRVGLRRLRAAIVLFAPMLRTPVADPAAGALKRLGGVFGAARDWDVFCLETLPQGAGLDPTLATAWAAAAERQRRLAHAAVVAELDGRAMREVLAMLGAWTAERHAGLRAGRAGKPVAELAPKLLERLARKVAKRHAALNRQSGDALHELRKALKTLRYGGEDFASLYRPKRTRRYLGACRRLSDVLGGFNDGDAAIRLAAQAQREAGDGPVPDGFAQWCAARQSVALGRFDAAWEEFAAAKPFWR